MKRLLMNTIYWVPDGGGGGGGGLAAAAAAAADPAGVAAAAAAAPAAAPPAGAWTPPADLPEAFKGKDASESLGKLHDGYKDLDKRFAGARDTISKLPAAPKSADEYQFAPSDKTKAYFPEGKANPVMDLAREAALKSGLPVGTFTPFVNGLFEAAIEKGLIAAPFDEKAEINTFKTALGVDDKGAAQGLKDTLGFAEGLMKQLPGIPTAQKADVEGALLALTDTAAGNLLLRSIQQRLNSGGIRIAGEGTLQGALTQADLKTLSSDPRIDPANRHNPDPEKRYDENLRKRYDEGYKALAAAGAP